MKILEVTPVVSVSDIKIFSTSNSGFGIVMYDIIKGLSEIDTNVVDVFTIHKFHNEIRHNNILFLNTSKNLTLSGLPKLAYIKIALKLICQLKPSFRSFSFKTIWYYCLLANYLEKQIKDNHYQLIHVHGCGFYLDYIYYIADKYCIPVVTTLHGLNSFAHTVKCEEALKNYEKYFLKRAYHDNRVVTFVSTGCINRVKLYLKIKNIDNFYSIVNGCNLQIVKKNDFDIREKYGLPSNAFIILYVGNIGTNKNQIGLIDAFSLLDEKNIENIYILFCGGFESREYELYFKNRIESHKDRSHFVNCGWVDKGLLHNYYNQANAIALLSFSEGFGLSIIEGMIYGLPSLIVKDMDVVHDIYDINCMECIENRNPECIANGIMSLYQRNWDKGYIYNTALTYSVENMVVKYDLLFNKVLKIK